MKTNIKVKQADAFLTEAAETFAERNKVYGDNWRQVGAIMAGLFPEGLVAKTENDWNRLHILLLQVVKLTRYANNFTGPELGHADSMHDNTVYSAILESIDDEIRVKQRRAQSAIERSAGQTVVLAADENGGNKATCEHCKTHELCSQEGYCDIHKFRLSPK